MAFRADRDDLDELLGEQVAYYRRLASEYGQTTFPGVPIDQLVSARDAMIAALEDFGATGEVLELACGPGTWTPILLRDASSVTAVDASPEMLSLAAAETSGGRVRFVEADLFSWEPDRRYDVVFFGFWLSHVPTERFEAFWSLVERCLKPDGRVAFVDDGYRQPDELIEGEKSSVIRRRLSDGTPFRAVKVALTPNGLEDVLHQLGWNIRVQYVGGPFFWGNGSHGSARLSADD